ncbi:MAG TPA: ComEC/Rec2 family competence protein, partial [Pyrinomonadaceae bacterium]|nr:ComEC/Rec2 family competence protein [Pyrinomonadaceae bacterium]
LEDTRVFLPKAWIYEWRARLGRDFDRRFSPETAGILDAVLLGNRNKISRDVAERFREGGTFHVLVIAGLHISFIAGLLFLLMRRVTRNRAMQFISVVTAVTIYSLAVGAPPPVIRAALVFSLGIFAPLVWRRANSLNVIAAVALALLVWRPSDLFDPSFQLTFVSVISIVTIAVPLMLKMQAVGSWRPTHETPFPPIVPAWFQKLSEVLFWSDTSWKAEMKESSIRYRLFKTKWAAPFERWHLQRPLRYATAAIILSASVQLGMLPLLIIYFHRVSFASLVLNIFVGVTMVALALTAVTATLVAQFSSMAAAPLIFLSEKLEGFMVHLIDPFNRLGIAAIRLPHYHGSAIFVYAFYFLTLGFLVVAFARWNPLRPVLITGEHQRLRTPHVKLAAALFIVSIGAIILHPFSGPRPDGKLHVDYLDVGQGDSALLTMPDGTTMLIDGGGRPSIDWNRSDELDAEAPFQRDTRSIGERVVSEYLWSRGLDRVDYILPTHADADHIDGLNDVANNFKVRGAIVARTPNGDREYLRFEQTMKRSGVAIEKIGAGDQLRFGDVAIEVLWPPPSDEASAPWRNNDGTVLRVRFGNQAFLFTADIEKEAEAAILRTNAALGSNIVKVAHHGSRTSSTQSFVDATRPSVAIISVGRTSIFGHPHKEVVERWRASGAAVRTTGEKGTISLVTDGKQLAVSTFVP